MALLLRNDIFLKTTRILQGFEEMGNIELEYKKWLETNYDFKVSNVVLDYTVLQNEKPSENYVVYILQQESRVNSVRVHELMEKHYREWMLGFMNIGLKYHLHINKSIEIRLFDFYQEICYDFQNIYNVHFDADDYYKTLNPRVEIYKCFRLYKPVVLFHTERDKQKYDENGVLEKIQEQYEDFLRRYDTFDAAKGESVIFGSKEQLMKEYHGDVNKYFD